MGTRSVLRSVCGHCSSLQLACNLMDCCSRVSKRPSLPITDEIIYEGRYGASAHRYQQSVLAAAFPLKFQLTTFPSTSPSTPMPRSGKSKAKHFSTAVAKLKLEEAVLKLIENVGNDTEACMLLAAAVDEEGKERFSRYVRTRFIPPNFPSDKAARIFHHFMSWAGQAFADKSISEELDAAIHIRKCARDAFRSSKRDFINKARINKKAVVKANLLVEIPTYYIPSFPKNQPYPHRLAFVAETEEIFASNDYFIHERKQPDSRICRKHIELLDASQLQFDLRPDQSAIFRDALTGELIAVVIRDACTNKEAIEFVDNAVRLAIKTRVSIRASLYFSVYCTGN